MRDDDCESFRGACSATRSAVLCVRGLLDGRASVTTRAIAPLGLALAVLFAAGANPVLGQDRQPSVELPDELARVLRDYERHWGAGDEAALALLFVDRGLIIRDGRWIRGRDAIREAYSNASGPLRLRAIEYATDGDVGFIVGAYGYGDEPPVQDRGMFTLTLRLDTSGRWLIVSDMDRGSD